jgi:hypothetical protein
MSAIIGRQAPQLVPAPQALAISFSEPAPLAMAALTARSETTLQMQMIMGDD